MYVHVAGTWQVQDYYLVFTFLTLAMLVIGGSASLWGAVVGTISSDSGRPDPLALGARQINRRNQTSIYLMERVR